MAEFPRPTYPGDFISCNVYQSQFLSTTVEFGPNDPGPFELHLPHDGLVNSMLYEVVFGPFAYTMTEDCELSLNIYHGSGPVTIVFSQTFINPLFRSIVPVVQGYFVPSLSSDEPVLEPASFTADFGFAGGESTWAQVEYGFPTIFAVRPVDQTNSDTFRIIQAEGLDLPYIPT